MRAGMLRCVRTHTVEDAYGTHTNHAGVTWASLDSDDVRRCPENWEE